MKSIFCRTCDGTWETNRATILQWGSVEEEKRSTEGDGGARLEKFWKAGDDVCRLDEIF